MLRQVAEQTMAKLALVRLPIHFFDGKGRLLHHIDQVLGYASRWTNEAPPVVFCMDRMLFKREYLIPNDQLAKLAANLPIEVNVDLCKSLRFKVFKAEVPDKSKVPADNQSSKARTPSRLPKLADLLAAKEPFKSYEPRFESLAGRMEKMAARIAAKASQSPQERGRGN